MTTENDPRLQLIQEHFETIRRMDLEEAQAEADAAAARGDEWWRKLHQADVDRLRAHRFSWEGQEAQAG
jgi:hypothetical protein